MKLSVITPIGPGHDQIAQRAKRTVSKLELGVFKEIEHVLVDDTQGKLGRGAARNQGMGKADWYFFLDADDLVYPYATRFLRQEYAATFGAVKLERTISKANVWPCGWEEIRKHKARGTLSMGFFVKAEVAQDLKFNEDMVAGEDFDFYMRLPNFIKVEPALVSIGYSVKSACGPKGYEEIDWLSICEKVIDSYAR